MFLWQIYHEMYGACSEPRGPKATRLRKRKADLLRLFAIPDHLLPGSMSESHICCGKPGCHCAQAKDPGPSLGSLTFMVQAKKHPLHIPEDLVNEVRQRVEADKAFRDAVREMLAANAELLALAQQHHRKLKQDDPAVALRIPPIGCPPIPPGAPHSPKRVLVSSPRQAGRNVRISRTARCWTLHLKGHESY